jgi:hypothetical protein
METKKTSKKSSKTAEPKVASVTIAEAPAAVSKPVKRVTKAATKAPAKAAAKSSAPKNSSHHHARTSPAPAAAINYDEVARLAYKYWEERQYAHGFAEEDWHRAEKAVRARS